MSVCGGSSAAVITALCDPSQLSGADVFGSLDHHRKRVGHSGEETRSHDLSRRQAEQSLAQGQQVSGEVAAVHTGDIVRPQRLKRLRVVPVVEMAAMALQRIPWCGWHWPCVRSVARSRGSRSRGRPGWRAATAPCWSGRCDGRWPLPDAPARCRAAASGLSGRRRSRRSAQVLRATCRRKRVSAAVSGRPVRGSGRLDHQASSGLANHRAKKGAATASALGRKRARQSAVAADSDGAIPIGAEGRGQIGAAAAFSIS